MTGEVKNLPRDVGSDIRPKIQAKRIPRHLAEHPSQEAAVAPGASGRNRRLCVVVGLWNVRFLGDEVRRAFRISKSKIEIRPMFHFTRKRIEAHVCICFVALKVYKELERLLKLSNINMSVDKVLALAQSIVTIQLTLPQNKQTISRTMLMKRHQRIATLFSDDFWGTH